MSRHEGVAAASPMAMPSPPPFSRIKLASWTGIALLAWSVNASAALGPAATARKWCEKQTLHYLQKRGYQPYNWSATTYIEGDDYVTKGLWRIDVDELQVECVTKKDGKKSGGRYKILDIDVSR